MDATSLLTNTDGAFTHTVAQRQSGSRLRAGRYLRSDGGRGACVLVQGNHHDKAPGWTAVVTQILSINWRMTSLAMNSGYRLGSMQSSGMRQLVRNGYMCRSPGGVSQNTSLMVNTIGKSTRRVTQQVLLPKSFKN